MPTIRSALFNPAGFSSGYPASSRRRFPTIEVHISNPVRRGPVSETAKVSHGMVTGFGAAAYHLPVFGVEDGNRHLFAARFRTSIWSARSSAPKCGSSAAPGTGRPSSIPRIARRSRV